MFGVIGVDSLIVVQYFYSKKRQVVVGMGSFSVLQAPDCLFLKQRTHSFYCWSSRLQSVVRYTRSKKKKSFNSSLRRQKEENQEHHFYMVSLEASRPIINQSANQLHKPINSKNKKSYPVSCFLFWQWKHICFLCNLLHQLHITLCRLPPSCPTPLLLNSVSRDSLWFWTFPQISYQHFLWKELKTRKTGICPWTTMLVHPSATICFFKVQLPFLH